MDTLQWERVAEACFTADGVIENDATPDGSKMRFDGGDEIRAALSGGQEHMQMVAHVAGQTLITWEDGKPHLTAYVTAWHWFAATADQGELRPADWTVV